MLKIVFAIPFFSLLTLVSIAQKKDEKKGIGLGLKAGYNFAKVTGASSVNASNKSGFHVGAFYTPGGGQTKGAGYRTELIFSRQGYNFQTGNTTGSVQLDYILLPQLATYNITRFFQIQFGGQIAFLINAKADSARANNTGAYGKVADYYNKIDYGFAGGIEIHPAAGLMVGARINISLANTNKDIAQGLPYPAFIPHVSSGSLKNNVLQLFAGWKF
jgi:Outer membrane protein beta-barrel domain